MHSPVLFCFKKNWKINSYPQQLPNFRSLTLHISLVWVHGAVEWISVWVCLNVCVSALEGTLSADKGSKFYGPAGPYGIFAGRDASRGLATFCLDKDALRDEYDDLSDLNAVQMESVREWEMQFKEKYDYVGRLLKPGEEPSEYTDEEDTKDHNKQDWTL